MKIQTFLFYEKLRGERRGTISISRASFFIQSTINEVFIIWRERGVVLKLRIGNGSKTDKRKVFLLTLRRFEEETLLVESSTISSSAHFFLPFSAFSVRNVCFLSLFDRTIRWTDNAVNCHLRSFDLFPASRNNARNYLTGPTSWGSILIPRSICRLLFDASAQNLKYICRLRSKDEEAPARLIYRADTVEYWRARISPSLNLGGKEPSPSAFSNSNIYIYYYPRRWRKYPWRWRRELGHFSLVLPLIEDTRKFS